MSDQKVNNRRGGGPKTPRGKNIARWNALKHGGTAKQLFISQGKHLPEYERYRQLTEELQEEMAAGAYLEDKVIVQRFVFNAWIVELSDRLLLRLIPTERDGAVLCEASVNSLRYIANAQRNFQQSSQEMRDLRKRVEETEAAEESETEAAIDTGSNQAEHKSDAGRSALGGEQTERPKSPRGDNES